MQSRQETVVDRRGNVIPGATVRVTTLDGTLAQVYSDNGVTQITNPIMTNEEGQITFHAPNGHYNITTLREGIEVDNMYDIVLFDPDDLIALQDVDVMMFSAADVDILNGVVSILRPPVAATPTNNGEMVFELPDDSQVNIKVRGSDGAVRTAALALGTSLVPASDVLDLLGASDGAERVGHGPDSVAQKLTTLETMIAHMPSGGGVPTGAPPVAPTGNVRMYYDTTNNKMYVYNNGWKASATFS